jgi:hypothetical protein
MPTVSVDKEDLWERLEQKFCTQILFIVFRHHLDSALSHQQHRKNLTGSVSSLALSLMKTSVLYISRSPLSQLIIMHGLRLRKRSRTRSNRAYRLIAPYVHPRVTD